MKQPVLIIAEAGVNHNGDIDLAKRLIDVAAESGADFAKFQTFNADRLATQSAPKAGYQNESADLAESQHEMLKRLELDADAHHVLKAHCSARGIGFLSTGFDIESIDFLESIGMAFFKIPSGEINNLPYLRHIGQFSKPIIMSTGMATLSEIEDAITVLEKAGTPRQKITVLHCTTEYPTPMRDVNLRAMQTIGDTFGVDVGYSDHTMGVEVSIAAVALGAKVIEKHFTLSRSLSGPDHGASLEPEELKSLVVSIRNIELALGAGIKQPTISEAKNMVAARKALVATRAINRGDIFSSDNITAKRPGLGISPMRWDDVIGQAASRDFQKDELIEL